MAGVMTKRKTEKGFKDRGQAQAGPGGSCPLFARARVLGDLLGA